MNVNIQLTQKVYIHSLTKKVNIQLQQLKFDHKKQKKKRHSIHINTSSLQTSRHLHQQIVGNIKRYCLLSSSTASYITYICTYIYNWSLQSFGQPVQELIFLRMSCETYSLKPTPIFNKFLTHRIFTRNLLRGSRLSFKVSDQGFKRF